MAALGSVVAGAASVTCTHGRRSDPALGPAPGTGVYLNDNSSFAARQDIDQLLARG